MPQNLKPFAFDVLHFVQTTLPPAAGAAAGAAAVAAAGGGAALNDWAGAPKWPIAAGAAAPGPNPPTGIPDGGVGAVKLFGAWAASRGNSAPHPRQNL